MFCRPNTLSILKTFQQLPNKHKSKLLNIHLVCAQWSINIRRYQVPATLSLRKICASSVCIGFSTGPSLIHFSHNSDHLSAKDMTPSNKTQIVTLALKLGAFTFILLWGMIYFWRGRFTKLRAGNHSASHKMVATQLT